MILKYSSTAILNLWNRYTSQYNDASNEPCLDLGLLNIRGGGVVFFLIYSPCRWLCSYGALS